MSKPSEQAAPLGTQRTGTYIGHRQQRAQLQMLLAEVIAAPICQAFYLEGGGGLGKTRFLEDVLALAELPDASPVRLTGIVDMIHPENRDPTLLEQKLIAGLTTAERPLPPAAVEAAFHDYFIRLRSYQIRFQHDEALRQQVEPGLRDDFVAGWNRLSAQHPLIIRLDTLERLFASDIPAQALPRRADMRSSVTVILAWMRAVLPRLTHTLVLLSGRPAVGASLHATPAEALAANEIARELHALPLAGPPDGPPRPLLPAEGFQPLLPFEDPADIRAYLRAAGADPAAYEQRIPYLLQITEGRPLLLSLFAEYTHPDISVIISWLRPDDLTSRLTFERQIIDTILDPASYAYAPDDAPPALRDTAADRLVLTYSLAVLNYARRGLAEDDLAALLQAIDPAIALTPARLALLKRLVLVKAVPHWQLSGPHNVRLEAGPTLLFLHDEIWQLIDESGRPDELGLRSLVLSWLSARSRDKVQAAYADDAPLPLLLAMADHTYYALTARFDQGYRAYLVYMNRLLAQRNYEHALILADVFWRLLMQRVVRASGAVWIYLDHLAEARAIDYLQVERHDTLHYIRVLSARNEYARAIAAAETAYQALCGPDAPPPEELAEAALPADLPLLIELLLAWAQALVLAGQPDDNRQRAAALCQRLIDWLLSAERVKDLLTRTHDPAAKRDDDLLLLRRPYLLGIAYRIRGQIARLRQDFEQAIDDAEHSIQAFETYDTQAVLTAGVAQPAPAANLLNDYSLDDLAYTKNNLAFSYAENSEFAQALQLVEEIAEAYLPRVQPYQQALFWNTAALIYRRAGDQANAERAARVADVAAELSGRQRATGLATWTRALNARGAMEGQRPDPDADALFVSAANLLSSEKDQQRDILHDHARYLRDLALRYVKCGEPATAARWLEKARAKVEEALALLPAPPHLAMQRADLYATRASIANNQGRQGLADPAVPAPFAAVAADLQAAEGLLAGPMPLYGEVVKAKVALQWGYQQLSDPAQGAVGAALRSFALALTQVYMFGPRHRDQQTFEALIHQLVQEPDARGAYGVPSAALRGLSGELRQRGLPHPNGEQLPADSHGRPLYALRRWRDGVSRTIAFFEALEAERAIQAQLMTLHALALAGDGAGYAAALEQLDERLATQKRSFALMNIPLPGFVEDLLAMVARLRRAGEHEQALQTFMSYLEEDLAVRYQRGLGRGLDQLRAQLERIEQEFPSATRPVALAQLVERAYELRQRVADSL